MPRPKSLTSPTIFNPFTKKTIKNTAENRQRLEVEFKRIQQQMKEIYNVDAVEEDEQPRRKVSSFSGFTYDIVFFKRVNGNNYKSFKRVGRLPTEQYVKSGDYVSDNEGKYVRGNRRLVFGDLRKHIQTYYPDMIRVSNPQKISKLSENKTAPKVKRVLRNSLENKYVSTKFTVIPRDDTKETFTLVEPTKVVLRNGCWYNAILTQYKEAFDVMYVKTKLTVEYLQSIFGTLESAISIETASKFFRKHQTILVCYDINLHIIFEYRPVVSHKKLTAMRVIVHNDHVYLLDSQKQSLAIRGDDAVVNNGFTVSNRIKLVREVFKVDKDSMTTETDVFKVDSGNLDVILIILHQAMRETNIFYTGDLTEVLARFMYDERIGITPYVFGGKGKINAMRFHLDIKIVGVDGETVEDKKIPITIHSFDGIKFNKPDELEKITTDQLKIYLDDSKLLKETLQIPKYCSHYSDTLLQAFKLNRMRPLMFNLTEKVDFDKNYASLDFNKSYSSIFTYDFPEIPVLTVFDDFEDYDGSSEIQPCSIYLIQLVGKVDEYERKFLFREDADDDVIIDYIGDTKLPFEGLFMRSGKDLIELKPSLITKYKIVKVLEPYRVVKNPVGPLIEKIFENDQQASILKKFTVNKFIGSIGTRKNRKVFTLLSKTKEDIDDELKAEYQELEDYPNATIDNIHTEEQPIFYSAVKKETDLINGFYVLQWLIYSHQQVKLYNLFRSMKKFGIKPVSVKVDCLYFDYEKLDAKQKMVIDKCKSDQLRGFKLELREEDQKPLMPKVKKVGTNLLC